MATIYYGMAGEGRGHATRVKAIDDDLSRHHRIVLYAPGEAWDFLYPAYKGSAIEVRHLDGLSFHYDKKGQLNYYRTLFEGLRKYLGFPSRIYRIRKDMELDRPDLVITDFDPLLPRAAEQLHIPYLSIDHQHFLRTYDLSELPRRLRLHAAIMGLGVRCFYGSQKATIVSSFYFPPLRQGLDNVYQVGVLLRPKVLDIGSHPPPGESFLTVYLRRPVSRRVLRALRGCGMPVHVFGQGELPDEADLHFHKIDNATLLDHLARGCALVCTAGNQLVGEALHLGKPVLALPEPSNHEQEINGHFVAAMGVGECRSLARLRSRHIAEFLSRLDTYRSSIPKGSIAGNQAVQNIINQALQSIELAH